MKIRILIPPKKHKPFAEKLEILMSNATLLESMEMQQIKGQKTI